MINFIKHYIWFIKESRNFMGKPLLWVVLHGQRNAFVFAEKMFRWDKLTPEQKETWYLSGEGRVIYI